MDPTVCLDRIRELAVLLLAGSARDEDNTLEAESLAQHVSDLDEWLMKGGHLPTQWPVPAGLAAPPF